MEELQKESQIEKSKIKWNQASWYSQIIAVVLAVLIFIVGFYLGTKSATHSGGNTLETTQNQNGKVIDFSQCTNDDAASDSREIELDLWEQCKAKVTDIRTLFSFATTSFPISTTIYYRNNDDELVELEDTVFLDTNAMARAQQTHEPYIENEKRYATTSEPIYFSLLYETEEELVFTVWCFAAKGGCTYSGLYRYNKETREFYTSDVSHFYYQSYLGNIQSPDKSKVLVASNGSSSRISYLDPVNSYAEIGYIDLVSDSYTTIITLSDNKRLKVDCGYGGCEGFGMSWIDNQTIKLQINVDEKPADECHFRQLKSEQSFDSGEYSLECSQKTSTTTLILAL